jgi:hypothetical protein
MRRFGSAVLVFAAVAWGSWLRLADLGCAPFWVDEAESAINALTILERGYPADRYLGEPIYENVLVQPWPGHPEFEFRDISYSSRGMAVYHGWLPLYAIAAALRLAGIAPDVPTADRTVRRSPEDARRMTVAARAPSVAFGALFLVLLYWMGRQLGGDAAGWAALVSAVFLDWAVEPARTARYFSAALALAVAAGLSIWLAAARGRVLHFALAGAMLALLFHTHLVTFAAACGSLLPLAPSLLRQRDAARKLAVLVAIVIVGVVPWAVVSGFHEAPSRAPMSWSLMRLPDDLWALPLRSPRVTLLVGLALLATPVALLARRRGVRVAAPPVAPRVYAFLATWLGLAWLCSVFLHPAASYWLTRVALSALPPGLLLLATTLAAAGRGLAPWRAALLAASLSVALLWATRTGVSPLPAPCTVSAEQAAVVEMVEHLRERRLAPGTRIYATPNHHLILTAYTGLPVQSIAPVRKSFLDSYKGDLLLLECVRRYYPFSPDDVRAAAGRAGLVLSDAEASRWQERLATRLVRDDLAGMVARVDPPLEDLPGWVAPLLETQRRLTAERARRSHLVRDNPLMLRGYSFDELSRWWPLFYYRFADPERRIAGGLGYGERLRGSCAVVLRSSWVAYEMPCRPGSRGASAATNALPWRGSK